MFQGFINDFVSWTRFRAHRDDPDLQGASFARRGYSLSIHFLFRSCIEAAFLFSCLTKLRKSDIEKLTWEEI